MEVYEPVASPRLFPALSREDRLHLDLNGYVVLENALDAERVTDLKTAIYGLENTVRAGDPLPAPAYVHSASKLWFRVDNVPHLHPAFLSYLTDPLLWGAAEEAVGGDARLEQSDVAILRPGPSGEQEGFGLHRGPLIGPGWTQGGLYHFPFVKTLTLLTDVGPRDGGTVLVPGSHRLAPEAVAPVMEAAERDRRLRVQVEAPAGSTLLFFESTIHGSGRIESEKDRLFIVGGYTPPMFQPWHEYDVDAQWAATRPRGEELFLTGGNRWLWQPRVRDLKVHDPESIEDAEARTARQVETATAGIKAQRAAQTRLGKVR
ncbi:MAG: phytanoyl-CoA dioxygenase family protein [Pseudomonadota bacterium]